MVNYSKKIQDSVTKIQDSSVTKMEIDTECCICFENCNENTTCGHVMHKKCLKKWQQRSKSSGGIHCPVCRHPSPLIPDEQQIHSFMKRFCCYPISTR